VLAVDATAMEGDGMKEEPTGISVLLSGCIRKAKESGEGLRCVYHKVTPACRQS
jgi:hypothetical protein